MTQIEWDKCYSEIMDKWEFPIYKYCLCMLNGDQHKAEDCVQNTFYCLYVSREKITDIQNIEKWLFKVAKNFVFKEHSNIKKENRTVYLDDKNAKELSFEINLDDIISDKEILNFKKQILQKLNKQELKLFNYYYNKNLPVDKIAEKMKVSTWTIYKRKCVIDTKIKLLIYEKFK